jgi:hypothetical protein
MSHEPLDLSALDAQLDGERLERLVRATMERAQPELERRALPSAWRQLVGWSRPTLAAAGLAALASAAVLGGPPLNADDAAAPVLNAEVATLPALLDDWLLEARMPTPSEMMIALTGELLP